MKSLKFNPMINALKALNAVYLALYCSGKYNISRKLLKNSPIDEFTKKNIRIYAFLR